MKTILLVDDDEMIRSMFAKLLEKEGFTIRQKGKKYVVDQYEKYLFKDS